MPLHLQLRTRFRIKRPKATTMEKGETSASNSSTGDDVWAKLVPLNTSCPYIELRLSEEIICSDIKTSPCEKQVLCQITRETDHNSALMKNKCCSSILVDGAVVREDDTTTIRCGSEMILGPVADGFLRYVFIVMPVKEMCKKQLKITLDPENAKCPICLNVWHDVVTVGPCLHNFCNGCFSEWLKRCQQRRSSVRCPQCRAQVQFVARNHFLHNMEEDILQYDSSLRHSDAELVQLESCSSINSPLCLAEVNSMSDEEADYEEEGTDPDHAGFSDEETEDGVDPDHDEETDYEEEGVDPDHAVPDPVPAPLEPRLYDDNDSRFSAFKQYMDDRFDSLRAEQTQLIEAQRRQLDDRLDRLEADQQRQSEELCRWHDELLCRFEEQHRLNEELCEEQRRLIADCTKMMQDFQARFGRHPPPPPS